MDDLNRITSELMDPCLVKGCLGLYGHEGAHVYPQLEPLASVKLGNRTSSYGIVKSVEAVLMQMPRTMETVHGEVATIFVVQALSYATRIMTNPWSKFYPTKEEIVAECLKRARIAVVLVEGWG